MNRLALYLSFITATCAQLAHAEPSPEYIRSHAIELPSQVLDTVQPYRVVTVGENHGTQEVPEFVFSLATLLSANSAPLMVGLEIQEQNQAGIDQYFKTGNELILKSLPHFTRSFQARYFCS